MHRKLALAAAFALAITLPAAASHVTVDPDVCLTSETWKRTTYVLDNGTRVKESREVDVRDCPGTSRDRRDVDEETTYEEDAVEDPEEACRVTKRGEREEYFLTNGTRVVETWRRTVEDCPGTADDDRDESRTIRWYEPDGGPVAPPEHEGAPGDGPGWAHAWGKHDDKEARKARWKALVEELRSSDDGPHGWKWRAWTWWIRNH